MFMVWIAIANFSISQEWQVTPLVVGDLIRVTHNYLGYGRGLIAQASLDSGVLETFQVRRLYAQDTEKQLFEFKQPDSFVNRAIAIKGYAFSRPLLPWNVDLEVWQNPGLTVVAVPASTSQTILAKDDVTRKGVAIYNDSPAMLYISLGTTVTAAIYDLVLQPAGYYETPFDYNGQIVGIWSAAIGDATVQEFF